MACKIRLYNPEWQSSAITDLNRFDVHGRANMYFEVFYTGKFLSSWLKSNSKIITI